MTSKTSYPVGCVIMASGLSRRFGSNKLLADFGGRPLLCRALDATDTPQLACCIVVTRSAEVEALCKAAGIPCLHHALPGRNDTVRLGLEALLTARPDLAGCMFLPGDQPLLRQESIEALVQAFASDARTQKETERKIFRLAHRLKNDPNPLVGSPVLFSRGYFSELRALPKGKGGSVLLRKYPERIHNVFIGDRNELLDADTPEALAELKQFL